MKKTYICPHCKKRQNTATQWQTTSIAWEFQLKNGESEQVDRVGGDHEAWTCPECGEDLPTKTCKEIEKILGW